MAKPTPLSTIDHTQCDVSASSWARDIVDIVGVENSSADLAQRLAYGRDRLPWSNLQYGQGRIGATLPEMVARPGTYAEVARLLSVASTNRVPITPFGAGSGVLGGAIPLAGGLTIDLKRLDKLLKVDEEGCLAKVQCGVNGGAFEEALNAKGFTSGHYPQSLYMSTVGGWVACRGAGQASTKYGKIEDMVAGLKAVTADGAIVDIRPVPRRAAGPGLMELLIGSEGTLAIILEVTLRIWPRPERESFHTLAFPDLPSAMNALRRIMQTELRPSIARLYDVTESAEHNLGEAVFFDRPVMCILSFSGAPRVVEAERDSALALCFENGAAEASSAPASDWLEKRYCSYSPSHMAAGRMMDTVEISAPWSGLADIHAKCEQAVKSVCPDAHFGAHWSHIYVDGACMYMTVRLPEMDLVQAEELHRRIWRGIMSATLEHGASISHHHGVGWYRGQWLREELNAGHDMLVAVKNALDPHNILNPGKLGMPAWNG